MGKLTDQITVPDLTVRKVEPTELVVGKDAYDYIGACDYPETSDYTILADEVLRKFGIRGKTVLEVGPGPGNLCEEFLRRGARRVVGLDGSEEMVRYATDKYRGQIREGRMGFVLDSVYAMPFGPDFDLVVCQNTLHQFYEPEKALQEMARVVALGGVVYVADFRRDCSPENFRERIGYTKPEIRQALTDSVVASLTKQEVRDFLDRISGISYSVTDAEDPRGLYPLVDRAIARDPVPHFRDYFISQRITIYKGGRK